MITLSLAPAGATVRPADRVFEVRAEAAPAVETGPATAKARTGTAAAITQLRNARERIEKHLRGAAAVPSRPRRGESMAFGC
jgi:hypothetical protein